MNNHMGSYVALAILCGGLLTSCSTATAPRHEIVVSPTGEVYVPDSTPPARAEVAGMAPTADDTWVPGYWTYYNTQWAWVPGQWQVPPQSGRSWVAGHWDRTARGWAWTPGHWE